MSNIIVMAFSPRNIVGCLLKKAHKGGSRAPQEPPRYALELIWLAFFLTSMVNIVMNEKDGID